MRIARLDPLRVEVFVPVGLYGRVAVGQRAVVVPGIANPGNRVPGGLKCKVRLGDEGR